MLNSNVYNNTTQNVCFPIFFFQPATTLKKKKYILSFLLCESFAL